MTDDPTIPTTRSPYDIAMGIPAKPPSPPEPHGTPGRPRHAITDEKRACVLLMAGMGAGQLDIAKRLHIGINTLRRDYAEELERGKAEIDSEAYAALLRCVRKDDISAVKFYLTTRCNWKSEQPEQSVTVNVAVTMEDILREIDGQTTGLLDVNKKPLLIERKPDATTSQSDSVLLESAGQSGDGGPSE